MDMFAYFRNFKNAFFRHNQMTCTQFSIFILFSVFVILFALFSGIQYLLVSTLLMHYLTIASAELPNLFIFSLSFQIAFIPAMHHTVKSMKQ